MKTLKFTKEPGYTYDLLFIFVLYFNKQHCMTRFINYGKPNEDLEHLNRALELFLPISDELLPFFYLRNNKKTLITQFYFEPYEREFLNGFGLATIQEALADYDQVIENVLKYYFSDASETELEACRESIEAVDKLIKKSDYDGDLKSALYSFFIAPIPVIQKLSYELMAKDFLLAQQYEKNHNLIFQIQDTFNFQKIVEWLKNGKSHSINLENYDNVYVSFCYNNKNCVKGYYYEDTVILIIGLDYEYIIHYLSIQETLPELDIFGNAISERNRVDILNLMLDKSEITIKDIEQILGFTGTNAYYHLSLMIKAGMIKTRNQGRTVLYSLNKHYFDVLCNILSKYSNRKEQAK